MPTSLTRRHVLISAAATAAVAAMPPAAMAMVEAPAPLAGWAFVVNDTTRPLLAVQPQLADSDAGREMVLDLIGETYDVSLTPGPHRWVGVKMLDGKLQVAGEITWSYRQALIDAGWKLETLS